jgi:ketosteroid isomerase-like protein
MRLLTSVPAAVATLLIAGVAMPGTLISDPSRHDELLMIHRGIFEAMILHHDASHFAAVALDELLLIPPGGIVESKDEALAGVGAFAVREVLIEDEVVTQRGNTAVVVARLTLDGEVFPAGRLGTMRTMSVFVRENNEWRLLARSLTPCLPVAVQAGRC